jgi:hypothetical protein
MYVMGISIDQVQLKNINPPEPVQESFNEVNQAQQEKEKPINDARRDCNKMIPRAEGEKDQRIGGGRLPTRADRGGTVARRTWPPRTSSTSRSTSSPVGGSPSRCSVFCGCAPRSSAPPRTAGRALRLLGL